jgi:hypothetical protein
LDASLLLSDAGRAALAFSAIEQILTAALDTDGGEAALGNVAGRNGRSHDAVWAGARAERSAIKMARRKV